MVGWILTALKQRCRLEEPPPTGVAESRRALRPMRLCNPKQYAVSHPGDLAHVDTLEVRPVYGVVFKQLTARDVVSRWDVIQAHGRAPADSATAFLATLLLRMFFPTHGCSSMSSEFVADVKLACRQRGLYLFLAASALSQTEWRVGANRTHAEKFYQITP